MKVSIKLYSVMRAQKNRKKLQQILVTSSKITMCSTYHIAYWYNITFFQSPFFSSENALISYTDKWCSGHVQMWGCVELQKQQQKKIDITETQFAHKGVYQITQAIDLGTHPPTLPTRTLRHSPML